MNEIAAEDEPSPLAEAIVELVVALGWARAALRVRALAGGEEIVLAARGEAPTARSHALPLHVEGSAIAVLEIAGGGDVAALHALLPSLAVCADHARRPRGVDARVEEARRLLALSARRARVLSGVARGLTNKEIAMELACAENTVEFHVTHLLRRTRAQNRTQLVAWFWAGALAK